MPANTTRLNAIEQFTQGLLVQWEWVANGAGQGAIDKGFRPLGRVVTRDDLPHMGTALGIQLVDDPMWVIDPAVGLSKGREFFQVTEDRLKD
jgi:hypothetical protein